MRHIRILWKSVAVNFKEKWALATIIYFFLSLLGLWCPVSGNFMQQIRLFWQVTYPPCCLGHGFVPKYCRYRSHNYSMLPKPICIFFEGHDPDGGIFVYAGIWNWVLTVKHWSVRSDYLSVQALMFRFCGEEKGFISRCRLEESRRVLLLFAGWPLMLKLRLSDFHTAWSPTNLLYRFVCFLVACVSLLIDGGKSRNDQVGTIFMF